MDEPAQASDEPTEECNDTSPADDASARGPKSRDRRFGDQFHRSEFQITWCEDGPEYPPAAARNGVFHASAGVLCCPRNLLAPTSEERREGTEVISKLKT